MNLILIVQKSCEPRCIKPGKLRICISPTKTPQMAGWNMDEQPFWRCEFPTEDPWIFPAIAMSVYRRVKVLFTNSGIHQFVYTYWYYLYIIYPKTLDQCWWFYILFTPRKTYHRYPKDGGFLDTFSTSGFKYGGHFGYPPAVSETRGVKNPLFGLFLPSRISYPKWRFPKVSTDGSLLPGQQTRRLTTFPTSGCISTSSSGWILVIWDCWLATRNPAIPIRLDV